MIRALVILVAALVCAVASPARSDTFEPAYLEISEVASQTYMVVWKVPALDRTSVLAIEPIFPSGSRALTVPETSFASGRAVARWNITVPGGLRGKSIGFTGLGQNRADVLVRIVHANGSVQLDHVESGQSDVLVKADPRAFDVVRAYTLLGIEHILTGFDHLLFVLSLVLLVGFNKRLLLTITAFTVAHSITLALATIGVIHVPSPPVEACIALSIAFVAAELIRKERGQTGLTMRAPWIVAFSFGLLHGLGFAGALAEVGLPSNAIPLALLFFNVGVECGQLLFVSAIFIATRLWTRFFAARYSLARLSLVPAYAIGGLACMWMIDRIAKYFS